MTEKIGEFRVGVALPERRCHSPFFRYPDHSGIEIIAEC